MKKLLILIIALIFPLFIFSQTRIANQYVVQASGGVATFGYYASVGGEYILGNRGYYLSSNINYNNHKKSSQSLGSTIEIENVQFNFKIGYSIENVFDNFLINFDLGPSLNFINIVNSNDLIELKNKTTPGVNGALSFEYLFNRVGVLIKYEYQYILDFRAYENLNNLGVGIKFYL